MKKRGFTLIEVLAVIVVIAVIMVIAVPKMSDYILQRKNQNFLTSALSIARELEYENMDYVSFDTLKIKDIDIDVDADMYDLDRSIAYVNDGEIYLNLVGKAQYEGLYVCDVTYQSRNLVVRETPCEEREVTYVNLTVNLNGGSTSQKFKTSYAQGVQLVLTPPTKSGYTFNGWSVTSGNSVVNEDRLKIGSSATTIKANWSNT